jgi:hypothetical protein
VVRWHGQVTIDIDRGINLDPVPPAQGFAGPESDITIGGGGYDQLGAGVLGDNIALWSGSSFPTRQQCSDQVSTNGVSAVTVRAGYVVCAKTQAGRIAALKMVTVTDSYNPDVADATVWELP